MQPRKALSVTALLIGPDNGCDWWRTVEPFSLAQLMGHDCTCALRGKPLGSPPDILVFRGEFFRTQGEWDAAGFFAQCEADRVAVVVDFDDAAHLSWDRTDGDPALLPMVIDTLTRAHLVTTTTAALAGEVERLAGRPAVVIPNAINLRKWQHLEPPDPERPVVAVIGGDSHRLDWEGVPAAFSRLAARHPSSCFRVAGYDPGWGKDLELELGDRYEYRDFVIFREYPSQFEGASVVWAPLSDVEFNKYRSPIRFFEATAAGAAFVGPRHLYGTVAQDSETGYLYDDEGDAEALISDLLRDESTRARMVSLARQAVREHALDEDAIEYRFGWYYRTWQWLYGGDNGTGASIGQLAGDLADGAGTAELQCQQQGRGHGGGAGGPGDRQSRYRALLPRDRAKDGGVRLVAEQHEGGGPGVPGRGQRPGDAVPALPGQRRPRSPLVWTPVRHPPERANGQAGARPWRLL
jgi:glycosyltransferase involved in cell wall biosynthesis